jgi:hypothetical protein
MSRRAKLAGADLDLCLDALDMAIELLTEVWLKDPGNTKRDTREIKENIGRMWALIEKLVVHAPDHYIAFCAPPAGMSGRIRRVIANLEPVVGHQVAIGATGSGRSNGAHRGARAIGTARNGARQRNGAELKSVATFGRRNSSPVTSKLPLKGRDAKRRGEF